MSDLISREEALNCFPLMMQGELFTVETIRHQLKKLSPAEQNEWVSIKDRLPNEDCECWITLEYIKTGNRVLYESRYDLELEKFYNQKCLERQGYKLVAWQKKRMPSPYKGE